MNVPHTHTNYWAIMLATENCCAQKGTKLFFLKANEELMENLKHQHLCKIKMFKINRNLINFWLYFLFILQLIWWIILWNFMEKWSGWPQTFEQLCILQNHLLLSLNHVATLFSSQKHTSSSISLYSCVSLINLSHFLPISSSTL